MKLLMSNRCHAFVALFLIVRSFVFGDLANLSSRQTLGSGDPDDTIFVDFEITARTDILLRHVGPALGFVSDPLSDPYLELYDASGALIESNDDWGGNADLLDAFSMIGSFPWDSSSSDAALLATLDPGRYRMKAFSDSGAEGTSLAEVFALDWNEVLFTTISLEASGPVPSFLVWSDASAVLIRKLAVGVDGPPDPTIDIFGPASDLIASNDDWENGAEAARINPLSGAVGFSPLLVPGSSDSAVVLEDLDRGPYSIGGSVTGRVRIEVGDVTGIGVDPLIGGITVEGPGRWYRSNWFGYYSTAFAPWIFHAEHGFLYLFPESTDAGSFFFDDAMGAWWWTSDSNYPYLYDFAVGSWLWYQEGSVGPRWFNNLSTGGWKSF